MTSAAPEPTVFPAPAVASGLESLNPSYFALVMATGIVSIASHPLGLPAVGFALLALNVVFYVPTTRGTAIRSRLAWRHEWGRAPKRRTWYKSAFQISCAGASSEARWLMT